MPHSQHCGHSTSRLQMCTVIIHFRLQNEANLHKQLNQPIATRSKLFHEKPYINEARLRVHTQNATEKEEELEHASTMIELIRRANNTHTRMHPQQQSDWRSYKNEMVHPNGTVVTSNVLSIAVKINLPSTSRR